MANEAIGGLHSPNVHLGAFGGQPSGQMEKGRGGGSGGSDGGGTMEDDVRIYVDAQDDKTRAQNDARFAEVLAELRIIGQTAASGRSVWGAALA